MENTWKDGIEKRLATAPYLGGQEPNDEDKHSYMLMTISFDTDGNMKYKPVTEEGHPQMCKWMKTMSGDKAPEQNEDKPKQWTMSPTISAAEFSTIIREMFDAADANHDQVLELGEFKQFSLYVLQALGGLSMSES